MVSAEARFDGARPGPGANRPVRGAQTATRPAAKRNTLWRAGHPTKGFASPIHAHGLVRAEEGSAAGTAPKPPEPATRPGNAKPCSARNAMQSFFWQISAMRENPE